MLYDLFTKLKCEKSVMSNSRAKISEIEKFILFSKSAVDRSPGALNLPQFEKRSDYKNEIAKIDYWHYIQSADYHYFVSRVLFMHRIDEYAFFCAQQCVENYLKAYLKYHSEIPPNTHDLI
jgi:hypothetical protein